MQFNAVRIVGYCKISIDTKIFYYTNMDALAMTP
jgi:hypothetical protein